MAAEKPRRLGRGLEALIPGSTTQPSSPGSDLERIAISRIRPNPFQPRRDFPAAELAELESSLRASGLLQPITVRRRGDAYELIAGERRLRAATNIGWTDITAIVRDIDDRTMLVLALVENLQRSNLNAVEEARGYRRLIEEFQLTQQQVADGVGKDRTTITNLLRLLSLPEAVQHMVEQGTLSPGHARALLALGPAHSVNDLAHEAISRGLSVRELEHRVREHSGGSVTPKRRTAASVTQTTTTVDPAAKRIEDDLRRYFQTDVRLQLSDAAKGKIELSFYSHDDLDRILDLILHEQRRDF
jgi:ParB family transcriptional regulator, chromosome partitioning protein